MNNLEYVLFAVLTLYHQEVNVFVSKLVVKEYREINRKVLYRLNYILDAVQSIRGRL